MQLSIDIEKLRERKLFVATPMYGGQCMGIYARAMIELSALCTKYGIDMKVYYLLNESLIQRARNYCVEEFMNSGYTHLMFIDADIGFNPQDVISLLSISDPDNPDDPYDVVCGPYPKKTIAWEKIVSAVDKGKADGNPSALAEYVGDYAFNTVDSKPFKISEPVKVMESGTGFMMIRKRTFDKFREAYPERSYKPDHARNAAFDGSKDIHAYFDCVIDPDTKRFLSEDYMFCQYVNNAGMNVWLCPWMQMKHMGSFIYGGSVAAVTSIGAPATVDKSKLK